MNREQILSAFVTVSKNGMRLAGSNLLSLPAALLSVALISGSLRAENAGDSFRMHTDEPLMVENTLLAPGNYVWSRMDSQADHHIVQIRNVKTNRVTATILALASYRNSPPVSNEIDFWETPTGAPKAVRAWFTPGENYGDEFPYPNKLIAFNKYPSPPTELVSPPVAALPPTSQLSPKPKTERLAASARVREAEQQGSWAVISDGVPDARQQVPHQPARKRPGTIWDALAHLPLTATIAPLIGLIGLLCLGLYLLTYTKRQRAAAWEQRQAAARVKTIQL